MPFQGSSAHCSVPEFSVGELAGSELPADQQEAALSACFKEVYNGGSKPARILLRHYRPRILAFLGKPAFAAIFNKRSVAWGRQEVLFGGAEVWVLPNPSGLNRAFRLDALVSAYRELQIAYRAP